MLEQQRLDYLQAMGVVQWLPRHALANAPAARWLPETQGQAPVAVATKPLAKVIPLHSERSAEPQKLQELVAEVTEQVTTQPNAAPDAFEVPNISLVFVRNAMPVVWVSAPEETQLLQSWVFTIQQAMLRTNQFLPEPMVFTWPYLKVSAQQQGRPVALQALQAQWQFLQKQGAQAAIAFSDEAKYWLEQIQVPIAYSAPSLAQSMQQADAKRALWQALLTHLPQ